MHEWCDSWIVDDGFGLNLACDLNEMVGIKETWYWYEIQIYIHCLEMMSWYGFDIWLWMRMSCKGWHGILCMVNITWLIEHDWYVVSA